MSVKTRNNETVDALLAIDAALCLAKTWLINYDEGTAQVMEAARMHVRFLHKKFKVKP